MLVQRFDVGRLNRAQRTGAGGARIPARVARTGVQTYTDAQGRRVREYRPPEEVFAAASLETLASVPVTVGHPPAGVTPSNYRQVTVGHVSDAPPGRAVEGTHEWIEAVSVITDAETLRKIDSGELVEVSMGYLANVVPKQGVAPNGEPYDAIQTDIRFNHKALLPSGHARAGSGANLRLDGNQEPDMLIRHDDNSPAQAPKPSVLVKIDGIDCEKGGDTHLSLLERAAATEKKRADDAGAALTLAQTAQGEMKAKLDAAEAKLAGLDVNKLVADELSFRTRLTPILPKAADGKAYDFTDKSRDQVHADAVGPTVMAEVAKLGSDAEKSGYIQAHLKQKLDAAGKAPPALHVPSVVVQDSSNPAAKPKIADKRADAFTSSWGAPAATK
ncbi:MAG: hypothetical protein RL685_4449 [Pseudomonadota bacterium]|jgi:hypothetical protein